MNIGYDGTGYVVNIITDSMLIGFKPFVIEIEYVSVVIDIELSGHDYIPLMADIGSVDLREWITGACDRNIFTDSTDPINAVTPPLHLSGRETRYVPAEEQTIEYLTKLLYDAIKYSVGLKYATLINVTFKIKQE